jgi:hypothetical protein
VRSIIFIAIARLAQLSSARNGIKNMPFLAELRLIGRDANL